MLSGAENESDLGTVGPSDPIQPSSAPPIKRASRIVKVVTGFLLGQGAVQGLSLLGALFLVRQLSIEAYAQFGLAMAFQAVFSTLMDLGFASTIVPLVGERRDDPAIVGRYVRSAKHLRDSSFLILSPCAALIFLAAAHRQHWSWFVQIMLLASILLALYSGGKVSYYSAPLFIYGRLREYYIPQVFTAAGRLLIYLVLGFAGGLNAWVAAGLGALNVTINGAWIARRGHALLTWPKQRDPKIDREMLKYILPASPAIVFSAFQAQITVFLISIFGGQTLYIAQVAALGRIAQIFSVLITFNVIVIEPYVSRLAKGKVLATYLKLTSLAVIASAPLVLVAFNHPQVFLWILGPKYQGLGKDIGWVILSACLNYIAGLMWIMNRSRKWVFWSGSALEVILLITVQIGFVLLIGVHNTREAVLLNLGSSLCYVIVHSYGAIYGFIKGPKILTEVSAT
jgi:O-antigen/teichoic acid export membrane protein